MHTRNAQVAIRSSHKEPSSPTAYDDNITLIESSLDQELSVVSFGLSDGELPNYVSLMVRLLISGFSAILSSVY